MAILLGATGPHWERPEGDRALEARGRYRQRGAQGWGPRKAQLVTAAVSCSGPDRSPVHVAVNPSLALSWVLWLDEGRAGNTKN